MAEPPFKLPKWQSWIPTRETVVPDLVSGATFALVNIPQAMANALLASVNPVMGLYTLIFATPVGALFTSSVYMNVSTTSALSVAAGDALLGVPYAARAQNMVVLVLMVGIIQLIAGLLRLGSLIRFVSNSVMTGFITGVALLIILGQVGDFTGYDSRFSNKLLKLADLALNLREIHWPTMLIGLLTIAVILGVNWTRWRRFSMIIGIAVATVVNYVAGLDSVAVVGGIATIPSDLLSLAMPDIFLAPSLIASAIAIAIVGLVQGAGVSQSYPNPDGRYPNVSRDFSGQGVANIVTSFFQGIPAGGSMSGTAVVVNTGMRTRWANIFAGVLVIPLVTIIGGFVNLIPMPSLAALLIVVGFQSFRPDAVQTVWQTGLVPRTAMGLTLVSTLILPLQFAVFVGVAVSVLLHVFRSSNRVHLVYWRPMPGGFPIEEEVPETLPSRAVSVFYAYGEIFFAAAATLEKLLPEVGDAQRPVVILVMRGRDEIGSTFIGVVQRYHHALSAAGGRLYMAGIEEDVMAQLTRTGMVRVLGADTIFMTEPQLGVSLNKALAAANDWLAEREAE